MKDLIQSIILLLVLLNPFLIIDYLIEIVRKKTAKGFCIILFRAGLISYIVFLLFAILGDAIFSHVFNASLASFQIFGVITGLQFVFKGSASIEALRGESKHIAGAIAMPIFIGSGTFFFVNHKF